MDGFTMDDYVELTPEERTKFDDWLRSCGACPERTREVRIDGDEVITVEWVVDNQGKLAYSWKLRDVETSEFRYKKRGEPPCWKRPRLT